MDLCKHGKKNERNQQKEKHKEWKCFRALPLHWFFPNDLTTTKTSFVAYDGKTIFKS
jgi:hypothetical protein